MTENITSASHQVSIVKIAIAMALIMSWVTLWISHTGLPYNDADVNEYMQAQPRTMEPPAVAKAGWPFTVFYYPPAPLGNDIPPSGSGFPFALNTMIYFILSWAILVYVPKRFLTFKLERGAVFFAFVITLLGLFQTILAFD
jgi:hypothetical protein